MEKNNHFSIQIDQNQWRDFKDPFHSNLEVFLRFKDGLTVTIIVGLPAMKFCASNGGIF